MYVSSLTWAALALLGLLNTANTSAQHAPHRQIDSVVLKTMQAHDIPGIPLGIVENNQIFYLKGYGTREVGQNEPVDSFTNFLTCSISKLFTATAIMQLVEQGRIDLNKKFTDYVPEFRMEKDERYKDITIQQMLTHTAGFPNIFNKNYIHPAHDSLALTEFAAKLGKEKLAYEPGVTLNEKTYSNTGYDMLGLVIERVTHQTYSDYINEHILSPVGMDSSSFFIQQINPNRRSYPHKKNWLTRKVVPSNYYPDIPQDKPCGNLNSCAFDLCQWMLHNLSIYNATNLTGGVVARNTLLDMWTTKEPIPGYTTSIGQGWWIVDSKKYGKYVFHVGNDPGYCATLIVSPNNDFGIVLLCNALYPKDIVWNHLAFELLDLFADGWEK